MPWVDMGDGPSQKFEIIFKIYYNIKKYLITSFIFYVILQSEFYGRPPLYVVYCKSIPKNHYKLPSLWIRGWFGWCQFMCIHICFY